MPSKRSSKISTKTAFRVIAIFTLATGVSLPPNIFAEQAARSDEYADFNPGNSTAGSEWVQAIVITSPALRSEVSGDVEVKFEAPGMTVARAMCWQQPTEKDPNPFGHDVLLAEMHLDPQGKGAFVFPADRFPNGPIAIRILANNADKTKKDVRELQLFNTGGVAWNQGLPKTPPPQADGMVLVFEDDFDKPLSISSNGEGATYSSHKPGGGDFSGWPFSDFESELNPFSQQGTYLRIRASKRADGKSSSGLITPVKMNFGGLYMKVPFYAECRLIAQSAPGTWPAFWTLTKGGEGTDELDVIEAYGGFGKGNPNYTGYSTTSHFWEQKDEYGNPKKALNQANKMLEIGGKSSWSTTFHTYGVKVTEDETTYYLDGIETFRHPTNELSKKQPHFFLINYAIGGISGWKIDLEREGNMTDMYVDYVRVYSKKPLLTLTGPPPAAAGVKTKAIGLNFSVSNEPRTELLPGEIAGDPEVSQENWNNLPGPNGSRADLLDSAGTKLDGPSTVWEVPQGDNLWRSKTASDWGFTENNLKLQKGYVELGGRLSLSKIPFTKYDVYVYASAMDNTGKGSVTLSSSGGESTLFYKVGWQGGKFVRSKAADLASAQDSNVVVFKGQSGRDLTLDWTGNLEGGWTGVSAVQVVEVP